MFVMKNLMLPSENKAVPHLHDISLVLSFGRSPDIRKDQRNSLDFLR